ncbi:hypothetical protein KY285_007326 [Solanum tuberosum]|nr:hypothetical protein KY285_007326 [Solanum tuberosum]
MAVSNKPTRTHGDRDGIVFSNKPTCTHGGRDGNANAPSAQTLVILQYKQSSRPSKPPPAKKRKTTEVKGKDRANKIAELESDAKSFDDDDRPIPYLRMLGSQVFEPNELSGRINFVSEDAWRLRDFIREKQVRHSNLPRMLEVFCDNPSNTHWVKNQSSDHAALPKAFMNQKAKVFLNWIINRWMSATHKTNIIWNSVFLIYTILDDIPVDIAHYKLKKRRDENVADTKSTFHNICVVLDPSEGRAQKESIRDCIKALEGEIQKLGEDLKVSEETTDKWMHAQFYIMIELLRGSRNSRPTRDIGIQINLTELEMHESSAIFAENNLTR